MTEIAEPVGDLRALLPRAAVLIHEPDTDGNHGRTGKPGSRPPWNPAAAAATYDTTALIADTADVFLFIVTGHTRVLPRRYGGTGNALAEILRLSHAVPHEHVKRAARELAWRAAVIEQLRGEDTAEPCRRVEAECPYCHGEQLWLYPLAGAVTCLTVYRREGRNERCADSNGASPRGWTDRDRFGDACIRWNDGLVTGGTT